MILMNLKDIFDSPQEWDGKRVELTVMYLGWSGKGCDLDKTSMKTRSDVTLKEDDYCILCDPIPGLNPMKDRNKIRIRATVELYFERPRLKDPELLEIIE